MSRVSDKDLAYLTPEQIKTIVKRYLDGTLADFRGRARRAPVKQVRAEMDFEAKVAKRYLADARRRAEGKA